MGAARRRPLHRHHRRAARPYPTALVEIAGHDGRMVVLRIVGADGNILRTQLGAH